MPGTNALQLLASKDLTLADALRLIVILLGIGGVVTFIAVNSRHLSEAVKVPIAVSVNDGTSAPDAYRLLAKVQAKIKVNGERSKQSYWILAKSLGDRSTSQDRLIIMDKTLRQVAIHLLDQNRNTVGTYEASRSSLDGRLLPFYGGFYLDLSGLAFDEVLIEARAVGSTKLSVGLQSASALEASIAANYRLAVMLAGAMLSLAAFTAVIGSFTLSTPLAASALWIISLFGVTCITLGYDMMWLEYQVPPIIELRFKQSVMALFMVASCLLYFGLFRRELAHVGSFLTCQRLTKAVSFSMPIMALTLPTSVFMPIFLTSSTAVLVYFAVGTMRISRAHRSMTISIFGWSWGAISICMVAEILYSAGLVTRTPGISFETGAIIGAFLSASAAASAFRTERIRRQEAAANSRRIARQYREIYNQIPTGLLSVDGDGVISNANPRARVMLGCDDLEGRLVSEALGPEGRSTTPATMAQGGPIEMNVNGSTISLKAIATLNGIEVTLTDVSAMAKLQETLQHQATHDYVTGALSFHGLEQRLESVQSGSYAVLHLEVTNLHMLSKLHGKAACDFALKQFYDRLKLGAGRDRILSRVGNGDFAVLWEICDADEPMSDAQRLSEDISASPYQHEYRSLRFEISRGLAFAGRDVSAIEALAHAQRASQENHRTSSEKITVFDPSGPLNKRLNEERYWDVFVQSENRFARLELWAQPIVPLQDDDGRCSLEVLLRVRDEHGEVQAPGGFLDAASRHSLMPGVDYFIVQSALEFFTDNPELGHQIGYVAVNLSSVSVNSAQFLADLTILIAKYPVAAGLLCLEITESVALTDMQSVRNFTDEMNALGISLALDDFGSGYTSFAYVKNLSAKVLKLDGSFVRDIVASSASRSIVKSIVALGHGLGMKCVAEWVTSAEAAKILREMGCDYGQGFHYCAAKPLQDWGQRLSIEPASVGSAIIRPETAPKTDDEQVTMRGMKTDISGVSKIRG